MDERQSNSGGGAAVISDGMIRGFLLCRLGEGTRARFEERLFTDDELERRVRLAEFELTDDYVFGRLSGCSQESSSSPKSAGECSRSREHCTVTFDSPRPSPKKSPRPLRTVRAGARGCQGC